MNFRRVRGVFFRYGHTIFRGPMFTTDLFYWPLMDILLWGLTAVWIQTQNDVPQLPLILMTGLVFWQIIVRGSNDISVNLLQEFWNRNLLNLFSTPLKISEWTAGVILICLSKLLITIGFGGLVVYVLYALNVFTIGWAFLPFVIPLLLFGWAIGFLGSGAIIYWGQQMEMLAWILVFAFAPFSAVFYPVHVLPGWAQTMAWGLPTTYIFEGMRSILSGGAFPTHYFCISVGLSIVYLLLTYLFFKYMFKKSKAKGLARLG